MNIGFTCNPLLPQLHFGQLFFDSWSEEALWGSWLNS